MWIKAQGVWITVGLLTMGALKNLQTGKCLKTLWSLLGPPLIINVDKKLFLCFLCPLGKPKSLFPV